MKKKKIRQIQSYVNDIYYCLCAIKDKGAKKHLYCVLADITTALEEEQRKKIKKDK